MCVTFAEYVGLKKPFGVYKRIGTGNGGLKLDLFDITLQIQYTFNNDSQKKHQKKKFFCCVAKAKTKGGYWLLGRS